MPLTLKQITKRRDELRADLDALERVERMFGTEVRDEAIATARQGGRLRAEAQTNGHRPAGTITLPILQAIGNRAFSMRDIVEAVGPSVAKGTTGMVDRGLLTKRGRKGAYQYRVSRRGRAVLRQGGEAPAAAGRRKAAPKGLTPTALRLLQALQETPQTSRDLAAALNLPLGKIVGALSRMAIGGSLQKDGKGAYHVTATGAARL